MNNLTIVINRQTKMSDLIDANYMLLLLLKKLNIQLGFGEKNIETVCNEIGFDPDCFIFLANFHSGKLKSGITEAFNALPLEPFLCYLKGSHIYFLEEKLPNIRRKLKLIFSEDEGDIKAVVLNFFDNYVEEVKEHMVYENIVVFPYINALLCKENKEEYSIDIFQERHNDIEEKMEDLKQILMKYISSLKDQKLMTNILLELYICQEELEAHTYIEDSLIIPRVRLIESSDKLIK